MPLIFYFLKFLRAVNILPQIIIKDSFLSSMQYDYNVFLRSVIDIYFHREI